LSGWPALRPNVFRRIRAETYRARYRWRLESPHSQSPRTPLTAPSFVYGAVAVLTDRLVSGGSAKAGVTDASGGAGLAARAQHHPHAFHTLPRRSFGVMSGGGVDVTRLPPPFTSHASGDALEERMRQEVENAASAVKGFGRPHVALALHLRRGAGERGLAALARAHSATKVAKTTA
jgi:hypothetical protein